MTALLDVREIENVASEAEVEAAARALHDCRRKYAAADKFIGGIEPQWPECEHEHREALREYARAALEAARRVRAACCDRLGHLRADPSDQDFGG
jgi:hypothetical protein